MPQETLTIDTVRSENRDRVFMERWLPQAMPEITGETVDISASILAGLYPELYINGPRLAVVESNLRRILSLVRERNRVLRHSDRWFELSDFIGDFKRLYEQTHRFYVTVIADPYNQHAKDEQWPRGEFNTADPFLKSASLRYRLDKEKRQGVIDPDVAQRTAVGYSFYLIPEENFGVTSKNLFLRSLANYYRYCMLNEQGQPYLTLDLKFWHKHQQFADQWGLEY